MAITLPTSPGFVSVKPAYRSARKVFRSPLTGKAQAMGRPADYWAFEMQLPPLSGADARLWMAALVEGAGDTVIATWPQPGLDLGSPGSTSVYLSGQTGSTLNISGGTNGYTVKRGQFLSFVNGASRWELKMVMADVTLTGSPVAVSVKPAIRSSPGNAAQVQISAPKLEGILVDDTQEWEWAVGQGYGITVRIEGVE